MIAGNWFSISMTLDATMKGRDRVDMQQFCVYEVRDGKIVREQFFHDVDNLHPKQQAPRSRGLSAC